MVLKGAQLNQIHRFQFNPQLKPLVDQVQNIYHLRSAALHPGIHVDVT